MIRIELFVFDTFKISKRFILMKSEGLKILENDIQSHKEKQILDRREKIPLFVYIIKKN